ncbi:MAG: efflux RND transporter periplasmic adaptor subunit [Prevotella sp.]|nr:efflux RND transporter periplasmic adaptor subunit [Prevotella sp.]
MRHSIFLSVMALCGMLAGGCHPGHDENNPHGEETDKEKHAGEIVLTHEQAEAAGLKTETVRPAEFRFAIKTGGQIVAAQGDERTIAATASGIVTFATARVAEGTAVRAGETVAGISAKTLQDGDPSVKAKAAYEAAKREKERAEHLVGDKIISEREYEQIRLAYETAEATYRGTAGHITANGVSVTSPISGYIKSLSAGNGEYVSVGQPIAVVTQNRRLTLKADVPEKYFACLHDITGANFKLSYDEVAHSLETLNGRLLSYGKTATANSAFIPVIFEFDNVGSFVSGSYADVYLLSKVRDNIISVPLSAVTEEGQGLKYVYIQTGKDVFRKQEVSVGMSDGRRIEITKGLKPGDKVVTAGTYSVKMAAASTSIPLHSHNH